MILGLLACVRLPAEPELSAAVDIDRDALPAATLSIHPVSEGSLSRRMALGERGERVPIVAYATVIEHPEAGTVVIDPGYGRLTVTRPQEVPGRGPARFAELQMGTPLIEQLDGDVSLILLTHIHADHAAAIADFPDAEVQAVEAEWAFGAKKRTLRATVPLPDHDTRPITPLRFDDGPYGPFAAHADVLGDGVIIALPAPGHTPGHTAYLVNLPGGSFLLTGDAAWLDTHWQQPALKGPLAAGLIEVDGEATGEALWRLRALAGAIEGVVVLSGHDPASLTRVLPGQVYR